MTIFPDDIEALRDLRDHLRRVTETNRRPGGSGWTYDDEIALLARVIDALEST